MVLTVLLGPAAQAQEPASPCVLVFGHGRNFEPDEPQRNQLWDGFNMSFNQQVTQVLQASGRQAVPLVLPVAATDIPRNQRLLLAQAVSSGCNQILETAVFSDPEALMLVARLRIYPLLGSKGPRLEGSLPTIGMSHYTNQRDYALTPRVLGRFQPGPLGQLMAQEALEHLGP
nr:hypothetical protein [uncultured Roseateles sp.]